MEQSPTKPAIKRGWLRALLILLPFIILTGIAEITAMGLYIAIFNEGNIQDLSSMQISSGAALFIQFFGTVATLFLVWLFSKFIDRRKFIDLGFSLKNQGKNILYGLLAGFVMMGLGFLILYFNGNLQIQSIQLGLFSLLQSFFLFILVAINEEVFVRGYLLPNFMDSINRYLALFLSSILFTAFHAFNPNLSLIGITNIFLAGILLGIAYIFTKNLWFAMALHFSWNFFQGPIFGFEVSGMQTNTLITQSIQGNQWLTGGSFGFEGSVLASILCSIGILLFWWIYRQQDVTRENLNKQKQFQNNSNSI